VKTFTLITVFGTGNAAKLSSGISQALVTTELGLMVAIPTLIAHGFLSHRAQKKLFQLEQDSAGFVTAAEERRTTIDPAEPGP
jgi:biopolymer transport protein ExbB